MPFSQGNFQIVAGLRLYIDVNEVWMGKIDLRAG